MIMASLREGHRARLQFSALTGNFTGYVRVFNATTAGYQLIPWYSIKAMIDRDLVRLDGFRIETSLEVVLVGDEASDASSDAR